MYTFKVDKSYKGEIAVDEQIHVAVPCGAIKRSDYIALWDDETASEYNLFETKTGEGIEPFDPDEMLYFNMGNSIDFDHDSEFVLYIHGPYDFDSVYNLSTPNEYENVYSASITEASGVRRVEDGMVQYGFINKDGEATTEYSVEEIGN